MRDERKASAVAFLEAAVAYYASLGVTVERVMTDNGSCYLSRAFGQACNKLGLKHIKPNPTRPKPTARPSASSKPACANGLMPAPTTAQTNGQQSCLDGFIATIGTDPWQHRLQAAHQPPRTGPEQPVEAPQLASSASAIPTTAQNLSPPTPFPSRRNPEVIP